ncbi:AMP-binding protein [Pseudonocardia sp.]|uniref:AMP-binding protein n=1 Tax=Pseudonocardia sp. TaxID=60912 RepID=UPI0025D3E1B4|nr:AMP-binding protein [Pseudonocardia sp.]
MTTPCDPARTEPMTLHAALDLVAVQHPDQLISFPDEDATLRYDALAADSRSMAAALARRGVRPGDRVGVLSPNAPEFLQSLFGIVRAGAAAAPLALPLGTDLADYAARIQRIVAAAGMSHIVVSHRIAARIAPALGALGPEIVDSADLDGADLLAEAPTPDPDVAVTAAAIVQFTSGSTAAPKGVVLTHANVWHCARSITEAIHLGPDDVHGSWLPLFHDMGLFGAVTGLFRGIPLHLWSPAGFVRRPARWLEAFAQVRGTISTMPNFGYDALLDAVPPERVAGYDLSAWRVAFNGAEAVQPASVAAFLERFAPAGFRPATMVPAYGMAEVTLVATLPPSGRAPVMEWVDREELAVTGRAVPGTTRGLVGLGRAVPGMEVRIGAGESDGVVGEVQLRGAMATSGYLGGEPLFTDDGWMRSGDLGYLRDGELFFTGRLKEMITVAGRNVYPLDVEDAARDVDGVHKGRCVAVAQDDPERVVLVAETTATGDDRAALVARIRAAVAARADLPGVTVHLVSPRTIPRTSSGKLRRLDMAGRIRDNDRVNR